jgi:hypothetical protein
VFAEIPFFALVFTLFPIHETATEAGKSTLRLFSLCSSLCESPFFFSIPDEQRVVRLYSIEALQSNHFQPKLSLKNPAPVVQMIKGLQIMHIS